MATPDPCTLPTAFAPGWRYWRPKADDILELGALSGSAPGLATHFHVDAQITLVLAGRRSLKVAGDTIELHAGRCLCIPAGVPHASLEEPSDVVGLIAFVPDGAYALDEVAAEIERSWRPGTRSSLDDLAALVGRHRRTAAHATPVSHDAIAPDPVADGPVGRLAARDGMSREGFTRRFARARGMPPHAFRLAARLEQARYLLRAGASIADVAAETGFADQSHLGRAFRRAYGVSPGRYRGGAASQSFQTDTSGWAM